MSLAWYIVAETEPDDYEIFVNGKAIAHSDEEALGTIFEEIGEKHLEEFLSPAPEELEDFLEDAGDVELPDEEWFAPDDGLKIVNALLSYLARNTGALDNQAAVISDLEEYRLVLSQLKERGIRWHLAVDF